MLVFTVLVTSTTEKTIILLHRSLHVRMRKSNPIGQVTKTVPQPSEV